MKHMLIVTDCFPPRWDGVARFLLDFLRRIPPHEKATVIAPAYPGEAPELPASVTVIRIPLSVWHAADIAFAWPRISELRAAIEQADILFANTIGPIGMRSIKLAQKLQKPIVSFVHSVEWELAAKSLAHGRSIAKMLVRRIARRTYNRCSHIICPSQETAHRLRAIGIARPMSIVHLGVDTDRFHPPKDKALAKATLGIDPDAVIVGFHGRIAREKDLPTLVRAMRVVREQLPSAKLLVVGTGIEKVLPSEPWIITPGAHTNPVQFLHAMDIYCTPSLLETTSLSTLEAMACGLPVIATPVGLIHDYIHSGVNGVIFPRGDAQALARHILVLADNSALRDRMGLFARKTTQEQYSVSWSVTKIRDILDKLASKAL